jgi:PAS domain S-box-containing protein
MSNGADPNRGLADQFTPENTSGGGLHLESRRYGIVLAALMLAACAVLSVAGYFYCSDRQTEVREGAQRELNAVANMKVRQLLEWRRERLADGRFFSRVSFVAEDLDRLSREPSSAAARAAVMNWLAPLSGSDRYSAVAAFDGALNRLAAVPDSTSAPDAIDRRYFQEAMRTRSVLLSDLHRDAQTRRLHLDVVVPVFKATNPEQGKPLGVLAFKIDPRLFLFPLIQTSPTFSQRAEAFLLERSGNDVRYWNVARQDGGRSPCLRRPCATPGLVSARFLKGAHGVIEGVDYRGVPVVAVGRRVAGTGWVMEAKMDKAELYSALRREMRTAILLPSTILLAVALLVAVLWRRRNTRFMQRELALERAAQERARLQVTALQAAANAIMITDREGVVRWVNDAFARLTGYAASEVVGQSPRLLRSGKQQASFYEAMWKTILARKVWRGEVLNKRKDSTLYTEDMTITPVADATGAITHFIAIKQDVTDRKKGEEALLQAQEALRQSNEALEQKVAARTAELRRSNEALECTIAERARHAQEIQRLNEELTLRLAQLQTANNELESFAYSVSHDLRAPLRSIDGFSRALLEDYWDKLEEEGKDYLQCVRAGSQRMGQLIDDLLALSRVTRTELRLRTVDLAAMAQSIVNNLQAEDPQRQITFAVPASLPANGDSNLLRIALENLLSNAWKFTSRRAQARVELGQAQKQGESIYFVRDNGAGFDMAYADKLFGAFQRLHTTEEFPGTGVGLATVQRIIHRHGGRVWAEARPEEGACFYFTLASTTDPSKNEPPIPSQIHSPG